MKKPKAKKFPRGRAPGEHCRHGDVLFVKVEAIPGVAQARESKVVAEGEVTGHAHRLTGDCEMFERDGQLWFRTGSKGAKVEHEEHGTIVFPPNECFTTRTPSGFNVQREWSPEGERQVWD